MMVQEVMVVLVRGSQVMLGMIAVVVVSSSSRDVEG